nr:fibroblast growth factor 2 isoform X2 [Cavia porcellus]
MRQWCSKSVSRPSWCSSVATHPESHPQTSPMLPSGFVGCPGVSCLYNAVMALFSLQCYKANFSLFLIVKLQLQAEDRGVVSIKGVCANRYLAMKEDGRLLASKCVTDECFFFERLESNNYNTYRSRKYSSWNSKDNSRTSSEDGKNYKCVWRKKESFERGK